MVRVVSFKKVVLMQFKFWCSGFLLPNQRWRILEFFPLDGIFPESLVAGSRVPSVLLPGDSGIPEQISLCPGIPE